MHIHDNTGKRLEVTDLNAALKQVRYFVGLRHADTQFQVLDNELYTYWKDILTKLEELKKNTLNNAKNQQL